MGGVGSGRRKGGGRSNYAKKYNLKSSARPTLTPVAKFVNTRGAHKQAKFVPSFKKSLGKGR